MGHFAALRLHFNAGLALDLCGRKGQTAALPIWAPEKNRGARGCGRIGLYPAGQPQHNTALRKTGREEESRRLSALEFHRSDRARSARLCEPLWSFP